MLQEKSTISLLRHGQPQGGEIFRGTTDNLLTSTGWQQMLAAVEAMDTIDIVLSSPLHRCFDFARYLARQRAIEMKVIPALQEIDFGQWEGRLINSIADEEKQRFWKNPVKYPPPGGESYVDFQQRIMAFWSDLLTCYQGKNCLLITHGGVQKTLLSAILKTPIEAIHNIEIGYACCSIFNVYYYGEECIVTLKAHG